ncbi:MAG: hypothetical protein HZB26_10710 [Candidatus Hydrogenedentes bacterium]|nr:hypothetical protein [Candidatus Hydrogenedentota bacterium]
MTNGNVCDPAKYPTIDYTRNCFFASGNWSYSYYGVAVPGEWVNTAYNMAVVFNGLGSKTTVPNSTGAINGDLPANGTLRYYFKRDDSMTVTLDEAAPHRTVTINRLREGIERFMITDINNPAGSASAQSSLPVMWDSVFNDFGKISVKAYNHVPGGCNVLFMDGHVEFGKYSQPDGSKLYMLSIEAAKDGDDRTP